MLRIVVIILTIVTLNGVIYAQGNGSSANKSMYPDHFTISQAQQYADSGLYKEAAWFYINIFAENADSAVAGIRRIMPYVNDVTTLIKTSFVLYGSFKLNSKKEIVLDYEHMQITAKWSDGLIASVTGQPIPQKAKKDCSLFKTGVFRYVGEFSFVTIYRDSSFQIETDGKDSIKTRIIWVDDCSFKLFDYEVNAEGKEILRDDYYYVIITEAKEKSYSYISSKNGKSFHGMVEVKEN